jgi:hypothetical protein
MALTVKVFFPDLGQQGKDRKSDAPPASHPYVDQELFKKLSDAIADALKGNKPITVGDTTTDPQNH